MCCAQLTKAYNGETRYSQLFDLAPFLFEIVKNALVKMLASHFTLSHPTLLTNARTLQNDLWKIWLQLPDIFLHRQSNPRKVRHCCLYSHVYVCHLRLVFEGGTLSSAHRFSKCLLPVSVKSAAQVPRSVSYISDIDLAASFGPFDHVLQHVSTLPFSAVLQTEGSVTVHCNGSGCTFALMR